MQVSMVVATERDGLIGLGCKVPKPVANSYSFCELCSGGLASLNKSKNGNMTVCHNRANVLPARHPASLMYVRNLNSQDSSLNFMNSRAATRMHVDIEHKHADIHDVHTDGRM